MKRLLLIVLCLALAALLLVSGAALAQGSTSHDLFRHVIAGGGGRSTGGQYVLDGTVGQAATGWSQSGSYRLSGGFWWPRSGGVEPPQPGQQQLYLPLVLR